MKEGGVLEKQEKWFRMSLRSYPATNCSSVRGVCSLKWGLGHTKEQKQTKKKNMQTFLTRVHDKTQNKTRQM